MKFKAILESSNEGGWPGAVPSLPGCISEVDSVDEALAIIKEAIEAYPDPNNGTEAEGSM